MISWTWRSYFKCWQIFENKVWCPVSKKRRRFFHFLLSLSYPTDRLDWALFSVEILFHHWFPLLEKVEIQGSPQGGASIPGSQRLVEWSPASVDCIIEFYNLKLLQRSKEKILSPSSASSTSSPLSQCFPFSCWCTSSIYSSSSLTKSSSSSSGPSKITPVDGNSSSANVFVFTFFLGGVFWVNGTNSSLDFSYSRVLIHSCCSSWTTPPGPSSSPRRSFQLRLCRTRTTLSILSQTSRPWHFHLRGWHVLHVLPVDKLWEGDRVGGQLRHLSSTEDIGRFVHLILPPQEVTFPPLQFQGIEQPG